MTLLANTLSIITIVAYAAVILFHPANRRAPGTIE